MFFTSFKIKSFLQPLISAGSITRPNFLSWSIFSIEILTNLYTMLFYTAILCCQLIHPALLLSRSKKTEYMNMNFYFYFEFIRNMLRFMLRIEFLEKIIYLKFFVNVWQKYLTHFWKFSRFSDLFQLINSWKYLLKMVQEVTVPFICSRYLLLNWKTFWLIESFIKLVSSFIFPITISPVLLNVLQ